MSGSLLANGGTSARPSCWKRRRRPVTRPSGSPAAAGSARERRPTSSRFASTARALAGADEGSLLEAAVFAAGPHDVTDVVVAGRPVVQGGQHLLVGDVAGALRSAINALLRGRELSVSSP